MIKELGGELAVARVTGRRSDALGDAAQGRGALQAAARSLEGTALLGGGELVELSVVGLHVIQVCAQKPVSCRRFGVHGPCGGREEQW